MLQQVTEFVEVSWKLALVCSVGVAVVVFVIWRLYLLARKAFSNKIERRFGFRLGTLSLTEQVTRLRELLDTRRDEVRGVEDRLVRARTNLKQAQAEVTKLEAELEVVAAEYKRDCELARIMKFSGV
jgi:hypothetical protein